MSVKRQRLASLAAISLLAGGCSMAPEHETPEAPVAEDWSAVEAADEAGGDGFDADWRRFFGDDPVLKALVTQALEGNRELEDAVLDVQRARAEYQIEGAKRLPEITASTQYDRRETGSSATTGASEDIVSTAEATVGVSNYELDLFGRVANLEEAALQSFLATRQARRAARISLIGEIASAYVAYAGDSARLRLARNTLENREQALALAQRRLDAGTTNSLARNQARTGVERARAAVEAARREVAQNRNALRLLVGGELPDSLTDAQELTAIDLELPKPADLDSSLLLRRPEIQRAEHELRRANARIGAARAAFFPRISISSRVGSVSADMDGLFGDGTGVWSFTPRIEIPIFDAGRREAQLEVAEVRKRQEIARYEGAIQQAFREVADALVANTTLQAELKARRDQVQASEATAEQARARFKSGAASFLPVLDAQRELFEARQAEIRARQQLLTSRISLYRALGGGWSPGDTTSNAASEANMASE